MRRARLLKSLREPEDVTHSTIAVAIRTSSQSVGSWERDEKRPNHENLVKLARYLGVREAWLLFDELPMAAPAAAVEDPPPARVVSGRRVTSEEMEARARAEDAAKARRHPKPRKASGGRSR
jgi:transcriptional regulator with XRE-family HTH domain